MNMILANDDTALADCRDSLRDQRLLLEELRQHRQILLEACIAGEDMLNQIIRNDHPAINDVISVYQQMSQALEEVEDAG